jgi:hypothetical protein
VAPSGQRIADTSSLTVVVLTKSRAELLGRSTVDEEAANECASTPGEQIRQAAELAGTPWSGPSGQQRAPSGARNRNAGEIAADSVQPLRAPTGRASLGRVGASDLRTDQGEPEIHRQIDKLSRPTVGAASGTGERALAKTSIRSDKRGRGFLGLLRADRG